ncbi:unnamed protein product [Cuscuta campestris]|uniref:Uncharacterized protein n=2 Tax=Cuscuta sect. Cleistogrammica TaxID=1824901 RepID=A0A484KXL2_9ASTE|nr:hypothetical protein DM860_009168 [Cuscuta australis]VFQ68894.1 unnamed protein product [Cuscuta campestris]VFQ83710.1 unnamed protein product [Cuscuta campestris]
MSRTAEASSPVPAGEGRQREEDDGDEDHGGVHPAMKAVVFASMAGAMTWTVARGNTAAELPRLDEPSEVALHLLVTALLLVSLILLLAMALTGCVHAVGKFRKSRKTTSFFYQENQSASPLLLV